MSFNNNLQIPKVSHLYDTLDSTNAEAIRHINKKGGAVAGAVYQTMQQSAGRGQGSNTWHATPNDNLTLSIVLTPDHLTVDRIFALIQLTGLAVAETVRAFLPAAASERVRVKWPNDVYVGGHKIAGVLVQNGLRGNRISWSVLGIGLNVNEKNFPQSLKTKATSLLIQTQRANELDAVRAELFRRVSSHYPLTNNLPELDRRYHHLLYRKDVLSDFQLTANQQTFRGTIRGVTPHGQLRVELSVGRESTFNVGELKLNG